MFFFLKTFNCGKPIRCILKAFFGKRAISDQENKFEKLVIRRLCLLNLRVADVFGTIAKEKKYSP